MNWKALTNKEELEAATESSYKEAVAIFKHSTNCSVSFMAKKTIERFWDLEIEAYFLDLIAYRSISNSIAETFSVQHQSPQMLLIKEGKAVYHASHGSIDLEKMSEHI